MEIGIVVENGGNRGKRDREREGRIDRQTEMDIET